MNDLSSPLAVVDMGSNSFRLLVGRVYSTRADGDEVRQVVPLDALREPVRLAAGLTPEQHLDAAARRRGVAALRRFGDRLRGFAPEQVRAVATNTLRVARNASAFLAEAEHALGFPIEVIAGREEARLIYVGASYDAPPVAGQRLVVDIGGGSTELIIGTGHEPGPMESLYMGCVSHSRRFFAQGQVDARAFHEAEYAARQELASVAGQFRELGWEQALGSSGTARALAELIHVNALGGGSPQTIDRAGLHALKALLIEAGHAGRTTLKGLKPDRVPVLPGGLAIMIAVFDELGVETMQVTDGGLRLGVLYDLLGRHSHHDVREVTTRQFMQKYGVDVAHAQRVRRLALAVHEQSVALDEGAADHALLGWTCALHEIGLLVSRTGYHRHSAYIAENADMPGFSRTDQTRLATLLLGQTGKLGKLANGERPIDWAMLFALRLAVVLNRPRHPVVAPVPQVRADVENLHIEVRLPPAWSEANPLAAYMLSAEAEEWQRIGWSYVISAD
ncbi:exopolyphosphatase [Chitinasiproducens palmae]|uniref:Exopolyphosphatase n=1 Tax=Chitinasiproducens palmae TaxID=1770053 RepID=A0A1H2PPV2_9BURK|nr:exopolyphosphatase [Chitinasiproducens palmae]SDV48783.1 Ppx/GppA phosphatase [Chitinasiproducens palmae]